MDKEAAKKYALVLFDISREKQIIDLVKTELGILSNILDKDEKLKKFLTHPKFTKQEKKDFFSSILNQISNTTKNFIYVLIDNKRIIKLNDIYIEFTEIINNFNKFLNIVAYTKEPLSRMKSNELQRKLGSKYNRKINIINKIDTSLIAGIRLEFDGQVIDDTIRTKLDNLKATLMQ